MSAAPARRKSAAARTTKASSRADKDAGKETTPVRNPVRTPHGKPAFPKKTQAPTLAEFTARLPLAIGKKFENLRAFLCKLANVTEETLYYGPKAGWGLRYLVAGKPLCALFVHGDRPLGIVSLDGPIHDALDWASLSQVARDARRGAHGSPSRLWLDVPLDGHGAQDFRSIVKAKLAGA
jgi:hypothetical protein